MRRRRGQRVPGGEGDDTEQQPEELAAVMGPLRVHPSNLRYFSDGSGRAVYLTGSHHWNNLQDRGRPERPPFDYAGYLDFLTAWGHNFIRLWAWEGAASSVDPAATLLFEPMPYRRTGPGTALDGRPKFDLAQWAPAYFARLRERVLAARDRRHLRLDHAL
jgi:hypothetical protein